MLPCRSAAIPSGCGAPAGNVAKRSTWPRSQAAASSGQSDNRANTPTTTRRKADIGTSSSKGVDRIVPAISVLQPKTKRRPAGRLFGTSAKSQLLKRNKLRFVTAALVIERNHHHSKRGGLCSFGAVHSHGAG